MCENMATVENLIKLKNFSKNATLVSKNCDCSRVISHVTIMEAPDLSEWVTGGEFVLTTWYSLSKNPSLAEESFRKLAPKIAAIGIKTHRFIDAIPNNILKIAEQYQLPLFEIKRNTLFRNLVNIIATQIQNYQLNMLVEVETFYKELLEASAYSDDIAKILVLSSSKIHQPCALLDSELCLVSQSGSLLEQDKLPFSRDFLSETFMKQNKPMSYVLLNNLVIFPCFVRQKIVGFIVVPDRVLQSEKYILICQQSASFLSVRLWNMYEDVQKRKQLFLSQFCSKNNLDKEYMLANIRKFGLNPNKNMLACIIYIKDNAASLYSYLDLKFSSKILLLKKNEILIIYNGDTAFAKLDNLIQDLKNRGLKYIAAGSEATSDIDALRNYCKLIINSLKVLRNIKLWGVWKMDDFLTYTLLLNMKDDFSYQFIKNSILLPIVRFDSEYNGELLKTLYIYSTLDSISKVSEYLRIHVNTVRYRLEKLKDITGKNIYATKDKRSLILAAVVADLENIIKEDWRKCHYLKQHSQ